MYFDNIGILSLVKLIKKTGGYVLDECHSGKIGGINWRYINGSLDIGSNNFDKFGNSTVITIHTYCAVNDGYPLKKLINNAFESAKLGKGSKLLS